MMAADRVIRWTTAAAVIGVAAVAAVASYEHAYDLVRAHGEAGWTARLVPLTVDGLIYASPMVLLDPLRLAMPARLFGGMRGAMVMAASRVGGRQLPRCGGRRRGTSSSWVRARAVSLLGEISPVWVSEGQGLPIGHDSDIALTRTFAIGGAR
jgi:Protein of unknown function (DUF2637)